MELGVLDPDARVAPEAVTSYEKVVASGLALTVGQALPITEVGVKSLNLTLDTVPTVTSSLPLTT